MSISKFIPYSPSLLSRPSIVLPFSRPRYQSSNYSNEAKPRRTRVLITGGSRGIGLAIATAFAKADNYSIQITSRTLSPLREATSALQNTHKERHPNCTQAYLDALIKGTQADISDPSTWDNPFTSKNWPTPDILINSAGISHSSLLMAMKAKSALSGEDGDVERIINTNLMGTIYACRAVSKAMLRGKRNDPSPQHSPCIINVSSLLATHGGRGTSVYSASKAGVLGLTRALAAELGPSGIRVNAIVPGYIETSMTKVMDSKARSHALEKIPLQRFGTPEEIAEAALFLAKNEYANNCVINLDGGLSAAVSGIALDWVTAPLINPF